jgi:hypothetical protein
MHGVSKEFVAGESEVNVAVFSASFGYGRCSGETLNVVKVRELIAMISKTR